MKPVRVDRTVRFFMKQNAQCSALETVGFMPTFEPIWHKGDRYMKANCRQLRNDLILLISAHFSVLSVCRVLNDVLLTAAVIYLRMVCDSTVSDEDREVIVAYFNVFCIRLKRIRISGRRARFWPTLGQDSSSVQMEW